MRGQNRRLFPTLGIALLFLTIGVPVTAPGATAHSSCLLPSAQHPRARQTAPPLPPWQPLRADLRVPPSEELLSSQDVFSAAAEAVYMLVAARSYGDFARGRIQASLGSAVAVTPSLLVTNAHLLTQHPAVAVKIGPQLYRVTLGTVDPCYDRAVLIITNAPALTPVLGIRSYHDLAIGETTYTIGTPKGLERSLGNGIVSGLRVFNALRIIQTTAPISPGSSGGALLDSSGNLIGITTAMAKHTAQNLNFAIAIDEFFEPAPEHSTPSTAAVRRP